MVKARTKVRTRTSTLPPEISGGSWLVSLLHAPTVLIEEAEDEVAAAREYKRRLGIVQTDHEIKARRVKRGERVDVNPRGIVAGTELVVGRSEEIDADE